jgi:hypothetical protein
MIAIPTNTVKTNIRRIISAVLILAMFILPISIASPADAATITGRQIALSDSTGNASGVTYTLTTTAALPTTGTAIKSIGVQFCVSISSCGSLTGFSASSSTLAAQPSGVGAASGWTVDTGTANELRIVNAANSTNPTGNVSIQWNGVHNPTANNTTFYALITTYSGAGWTGVIDTGTVALSTAAQITVALAVNETLTFCAGTSVTGQNCGTVAGTAVTLPTASVSATSVGTSVLSASTNATGGYAITFVGGALGPLTSLTGGGTSSVGTSQFGFNLVANTTPSVGAARTGSGTATAVNGYGTADSFKYASAGLPIATVGGPTDGNTFTVSYIANIAGTTPAGNYQTAITYIATANF